MCCLAVFMRDEVSKSPGNMLNRGLQSCQVAFKDFRGEKWATWYDLNS